MKKTIAILVAGLGLLTARADYSNAYFSWDVSAESDFSYAMLKYALTDGGAASGYLTIGDTAFSKVAANGGGSATDPVLAALGATDWSDYSFQVELYSSANDLVGRSDTVAFSSLGDYIYTDMSAPTATYSFEATAVPEPTTGMLVMFGLGLLGLKRKEIIV